MKVLWNFWDGLCLNGFKTLCIASHLHYNHDSCILDMCLLSCNDCVLLSLDWAKLMMFLNLYVICSCIFMYMYFHFLIFLYITVLVLFWFSLSLSLHSCVSLLLWHLRLRTLYVLGHLLPPTPHLLLFGSMMRTPERTSRRTFVDEAFIQNATSFYRIFLTLTYPLSFTVGVGSHFVTF